MLTGKALGDAVAEAIRRKGVAKTAVADHFGIRGPSIYDWIKHGRVGKQHLNELVAYFSDVVGPEHWGLKPGGLAAPASNDDAWTDVTAYAHAAGMGTGPEAQEWAETHGLKFRRDSLQRKRLKASTLRVMYGDGDSMEPTIRPGDAILFDLADTTPRHRSIYVLLVPGAGGEEYVVKRAILSKGSVSFASDNPDGDHSWREPRPLGPGMKIVGRVRWTGGWVK